MTCFAGSRYPRVIFASPVWHPPSVRHSASSPGPAARWIAPSTPPPPRSDGLAALTMASTASVVMSPRSARRSAIGAHPAGEIEHGAVHPRMVGVRGLRYSRLDQDQGDPMQRRTLIAGAAALVAAPAVL